jgi:dTMP kinase
MSGLFITFEGPEGAGKSTQIALAKSWLEAEGQTVVQTREPGGTTMGKAIRELLLHQDGMTPVAEYLLYSADRAEHMQTVIRPAVQAGHTVLCDRWLDSSLAYQGYGRGLELDWLRAVGHGATGGTKPVKTILLDLAPEIGLARFATRDRLEAEPIAFHQRVRAGYLALAAAEPGRFSVVDAAQKPEDVQLQIKQILEALF